MDNTTTSPNAETSADLRSPAEWCHIEGVQILDADGWRGRDGRDFTDPISLAEFRERLVVCTQRSIPLQESPITGPQYPRPQQPGGVTIGSTSGPWLAGAPIDASLPAGERHAGEGNHEGPPPVVYWCPLSRQLVDVGHGDTCPGFGLHEPVLTVVYAAIRQQVAEEIAVAIYACVTRNTGPLFQGADSAFEGSARLAREIGAKA